MLGLPPRMLDPQRLSPASAPAVTSTPVVSPAGNEPAPRRAPVHPLGQAVLVVALGLSAAFAAYWLSRRWRGAPPALDAAVQSPVAVAAAAQERPDPPPAPPAKRPSLVPAAAPRRASEARLPARTTAQPTAGSAPRSAPGRAAEPVKTAATVAATPTAPPPPAGASAPSLVLSDEGEHAPPDEATLNAERSARIMGESVSFVIKSHRPQLSTCYERAFKNEDTSPPARVDIDFTIDRDGRAQRIKTHKNTSDNQALANCLENLLGQWQFPQPPDGEFPTSYPFVFTGGR